VARFHFSCRSTSAGGASAGLYSPFFSRQKRPSAHPQSRRCRTSDRVGTCASGRPRPASFGWIIDPDRHDDRAIALALAASALPSLAPVCGAGLGPSLSLGAPELFALGRLHAERRRRLRRDEGFSPSGRRRHPSTWSNRRGIRPCSASSFSRSSCGRWREKRWRYFLAERVEPKVISGDAPETVASIAAQ